MKGLQIKIKEVWAALPEDFELDFQQTSYVFNKQGTFSYPFEIPLVPNRVLVHNIADPFGNIHISHLDNTPAEIWFDGIMLYKGIIRTDNEVEIEDTLPLTFYSDQSDFESRIEGMQLRDVPLDRDIELGYVVEEAWTAITPPKPFVASAWYVGLPKHIMMNYTKYNVSEPYPIKPYCNVRVCTSNGVGMYKILDARRPYSGVCFYLMYFIDCLFKYLNIPVDKTPLEGMEDLNRVAFFTTQCHTEEKGDPFTVPLSEIRKEDFCGEDFEIGQDLMANSGTKTFIHRLHASDYVFSARKVYATNKNFPDAGVEDLLEDMVSAFGIRFLFNSQSGRVTVVLLKDVFRRTDALSLNVPVLGYSLSQTKAKKIRLTYAQKDDTAFNYSDWSNVAEFDGYAEILAQGVSAFDTRCFIDRRTGNAYRVKVNKDTGRDPSLFEVGGFGDFVTGDSGNEEEEEIKINFSPVVLNDVTRHVKEVKNADPNLGQILAAYADVELLPDDVFDGELPYISVASTFDPNTVISAVKMKSKCPENYDFANDSEPPLRSYDAGYTLGIMRGPGNDAKIEYTRPNYDGEGNSSFVFVESTYAFTADSCNNYGMFYDYNGLEPGGADQEGRFSLKLSAKKMDGDTPLPIDTAYENRGLVSKFLSEYLYFMAHKKTVTLLVDMTVSQIINVDFSRRYRIGDYCGFINRINYTLGVDGARDVEIELYTL